MAEVEASLAEGANPNSRTERGTVLRFAVSRLWGDMVHRLLAGGADPNLKDPATGQTALWGLRDSLFRDGRVAERMSMLDALLAARADINVRSQWGGSVLIDVTVDPRSNLALMAPSHCAIRGAGFPFFA